RAPAAPARGPVQEPAGPERAREPVEPAPEQTARIPQGQPQQKAPSRPPTNERDARRPPSPRPPWCPWRRPRRAYRDPASPTPRSPPDSQTETSSSTQARPSKTLSAQRAVRPAPPAHQPAPSMWPPTVRTTSEPPQFPPEWRRGPHRFPQRPAARLMHRLRRHGAQIALRADRDTASRRLLASRYN